MKAVGVLLFCCFAVLLFCCYGVGALLQKTCLSDNENVPVHKVPLYSFQTPHVGCLTLITRIQEYQNFNDESTGE